MDSGYDAPFLDDRIKQLNSEMIERQKRTCTKWLNAILNPENLEISDLFIDLADGFLFSRLLEILTGTYFQPKFNRSKQKFIQLDNINKCLRFLEKKLQVQMKEITALDIVHGNPAAILGLIRTIMICLPKFLANEGENVADKTESRKALLYWCQERTQGYARVHVQDFGPSWRDGLAFNALLQSQGPNKTTLDFSRLQPNEKIENLKLAFNLAQQQFEIPTLLSVGDVDNDQPEEICILAYVALCCLVFHKQSINRSLPLHNVSCLRVPNVLSPTPTKSENKNATSVVPPYEDLFKDETDSNNQINDDSSAGKTNKNVPCTTTNHESYLVSVPFPGSWECDYCAFENHSAAQLCLMCYKKKCHNDSGECEKD